MGVDGDGAEREGGREEEWLPVDPSSLGMRTLLLPYFKPKTSEINFAFPFRLGMQDSAPSLRLLSDPVRFLLTFCYIFDKVLLSTDFIKR